MTKTSSKAMQSNDNPNLESSRSQTRAILSYLREGNSITPAEARKLFGCDRLSGRIMDIEKIVGYKPLRKMVKVSGIDPNGRSVMKRVMQYWLQK